MKNRIQFVRKNARLTQTEFAQRLNLTKNFISLIENGNREPSDRTISDICREFGCDEIWLRTGKGDPFRKEDRTEQIMKFASEICTGSDEFRKAFVAMLAKMDVEDWNRLAALFQEISDSIEKE